MDKLFRQRACWSNSDQTSLTSLLYKACEAQLELSQAAAKCHRLDNIAQEPWCKEGHGLMHVCVEAITSVSSVEAMTIASHVDVDQAALPAATLTF